MEQDWKKNYSRYKGFFLNILSIYNNKPNLKIYLELALSLTTIIIFAVFAIKPTIVTIIELSQEIKNKEEIITKLDQKITTLKLVSNILNSEADELVLVNQAVPSMADMESVIKQIEILASTNVVEIRNIASADVVLRGDLVKTNKSIEVAELPNGTKGLDMTISVSGQYADLFNFMKSLETLRRPIRIDSYIFNTNKTVDNNKVIILTIIGRFPYE